MSLNNPQNLENCLNRDFNRIKRKASKIVTLLPENALTPIPKKDVKDVLANQKDKKELKDAQRTAVFIRRMEYATTMKRQMDEDKNLKNQAKKIALIQEWWKTMYKIIKLQKNMRGFLFRKKLMNNLEHQEKLLQFITEFDNIHSYHLYKQFMDNLKRKRDYENSKLMEKCEDFNEKLDNLEKLHNYKNFKNCFKKWKDHTKQKKKEKGRRRNRKKEIGRRSRKKEIGRRRSRKKEIEIKKKKIEEEKRKEGLKKRRKSKYGNQISDLGLKKILTSLKFAKLISENVDTVKDLNIQKDNWHKTVRKALFNDINGYFKKGKQYKKFFEKFENKINFFYDMCLVPHFKNVLMFKNKSFISNEEIRNNLCNNNCLSKDVLISLHRKKIKILYQEKEEKKIKKKKKEEDELMEFNKNKQLRDFCEKLLTRNVKERIGAKEGLEIIKKIKEEREELYRKEEEEERNGDEQDEINKDREDYNTFWSAFAGRIGMGV